MTPTQHQQRTNEINRNIIIKQNSMLLEKMAIIKANDLYIDYQDRVIRKLQGDLKMALMRNRN